jgi:two-component system alkaline phosphatase synthesis response regulator PhoP
MLSKNVILIVDDEESILQLVQMYLEKEGFQVITSQDGLEALDLIYTNQPDLVVLDIMLPGLDGLEICKRLRANDNLIPVLFLTARDDDIDKILGLEFGADDYLTKPFNPREMVARIKAIFRRENYAQSTPNQKIRIGDVVIDKARREVTVSEIQVDLRHQEFNVLLALAEHKGIVLTRQQLLDLAWGYSYYGHTRTVDVHIGQLRKKLASSCVQIKTVVNNGYKLIG